MANQVFAGRGTTVFETMSRLAVETGAVNLGQGFPDEDGPMELRQAAGRYLAEGPNQYPPMLGVPELRQAVADDAKRFYGLDVDWKSQVMVTSGATEALADSFLALIEPGDEAIVIEPFYDAYLPMLERAGAVVRTVPLEPPSWRLPHDRLEAAFNDRTRVVVLNNPQNPAAAVIASEDLRALAGLIERHEAVAVCDEVYEHLTFDGARHVPLMALPGMAERCVRIGSAGKTFSFTGWKVGYLTGPQHLVSLIAKAHQFVTFTTPPALQKAVADGLRSGDDYFAAFTTLMRAKRDRLASGLEVAGFETLPCSGTYFLNVDIRSIGYAGPDDAFCREIIENAGVAGIPLSAFYRPDSPDRAEHIVRFCFAKQDAVLDDAIDRLAGFVRDRARAA